MKLYLHYDGEPEFTTVWKATKQDATVADLQNAFIEAFTRKTEAAGSSDPSQVVARTSKGRQLQPGRSVASAFTDRDDVFFTLGSGADSGANAWQQQQQAEMHPAAAAPSAAAPASTPTTAAATPATTASPEASLEARQPRHEAARPPRREATVPAEQQDSFVNPIIEQAAAAEKGGNYRAAADLYEKVLDAIPGHREPLLGLLRLWLQAGHPEKAAALASEATSVGWDHDSDREVFELYGDALLAAGDPEGAQRRYERAMGLASKQLQGTEGMHARRGLQLKLASALIEQEDDPSRRSMGAGLVADVLEQEPGSWQAQFLMAKIAVAHEKWDEASGTVLQLLVQEPDNKDARELFARVVLAQQAGARQLMVQLTPSPSGPQAMAFLASVLKDLGGVPEAALLLKRCFTLRETPAFALSYMHTLELQQSYPQALEVAAKVLGSAKGHEHALGLLRDVAVGMLQGVVDRGGFQGLMGYYQTVKPSVEPGDEPCAGPSPEAARAQRHALSSGGGGLDALAVLMTSVKILYLTGDLQAAAALCSRVVSPAVAGCSLQLHTTPIRNEAAYYGCVAQLLASATPPPYDEEAAAAPIYLIGDSHCLPAAWRHVTLRDQRRLLVPALVTGCKVWHLRPEGRFYTKAQFNSIVAALPKEAKVIVLLGEIDCREGIRQAVDRLKYSSLEEALRELAELYVKTLRDVAHRRRAEVFVHPVPPVLDQTRPVVRAFNAAVASALAPPPASDGEGQQEEPAPSGAGGGGSVRWLDFEDNLLEQDLAEQGQEAQAERLAEGLRMDGTHLSPGYVRHLDAALAKM